MVNRFTMNRSDARHLAGDNQWNFSHTVILISLVMTGPRIRWYIAGYKAYIFGGCLCSSPFFLHFAFRRRTMVGTSWMLPLNLKGESTRNVFVSKILTTMVKAIAAGKIVLNPNQIKSKLKKKKKNPNKAPSWSCRCLTTASTYIGYIYIYIYR